MESWKSILSNIRPRAFKIDLEDVRVDATETTGFVTCVEIMDADDSKGRCVCVWMWMCVCVQVASGFVVCAEVMNADDSKGKWDVCVCVCV